MRIAPSWIQALLSRGALWRASFGMRDRERIARLQKCRHVKRETGPGKKNGMS
jgi:hypothetical protein